LETEVTKAIKEKLGFLVFKEIKVNEVIAGNQEKKASRASPDFLEFREFRVTKVKKVRLDHLAIKVIKVSVVIKVIKVKLVHWVIKAKEEIKVKKDNPEALECQASQGRRD
jgi:hypothetical protein